MYIKIDSRERGFEAIEVLVQSIYSYSPGEAFRAKL
jgi:hypothetical protein